MPYNTKVKVPRITAEQRAAFEAEFPGFLRISKVPVIETKEQAAALSESIANKELDRYEYVSQTVAVKETSTGWEFEYRIAGD